MSRASIHDKPVGRLWFLECMPFKGFATWNFWVSPKVRHDNESSIIQEVAWDAEFYCG